MFNSGSSFGKSANSSGDRLQPCKQMDEDLGDSCGLILRLLAQVLLYFNRLIDGGKNANLAIQRPGC